MGVDPDVAKRVPASSALVLKARPVPAGVSRAAGRAMEIIWAPFVKAVVASIVYSLIGIVMFAASFIIIRLVTPFSLRKEIEEDQNTALAILIGSVILGLSIIIAAAIGG
jgi:hypothetical protein